jgi:hypothetical protein
MTDTRYHDAVTKAMVKLTAAIIADAQLPKNMLSNEVECALLSFREVRAAGQRLGCPDPTDAELRDMIRGAL